MHSALLDMSLGEKFAGIMGSVAGFQMPWSMPFRMPERMLLRRRKMPSSPSPKKGICSSQA